MCPMVMPRAVPGFVFFFSLKHPLILWQLEILKNRNGVEKGGRGVPCISSQKPGGGVGIKFAPLSCLYEK